MRVAALRVLGRADWGVALLAAAVALCGVVFVDSASGEVGGPLTPAVRHALFVLIGGGAALGLVLVHYGRIMRAAVVLYLLGVVALALLPWFGAWVNGARRWYRMPGGVSLQPSEFVKLTLIVALAAWLRFRHKAQTWDGLVVPVLITAVPAALVLEQPDLGSSLVLWPILLAMSFVAGTPARAIRHLLLLGLAVVGLGYFALHDYQRTRIDVWWEHFAWQPELGPGDGEQAHADWERMRERLRGPAYQPWQALIAIGSGGWTGQGIGEGPQNVHGFLPYRSSDYVFAVVAEETGWLGCAGLIALQMLLVLAILGVAVRSRERFGRLLAVGVATWIGTQSLLHAAVCAWLIPATGLPMPLVSQGGSCALATLLGVGLVLNVSARREPVLAADGFT